MTCLTRISRFSRPLLVLVGLIVLAACATTSPGSSSSFDIDSLPSQDEIARQLDKGSLTPELRAQIIRLYSRDAVQRARAAFHLGNMAEGAAPAVTYLIRLLPDNTPVQLSSYLGGGYTSSLETTPGQEAARALAEIGDQASNALILALSDRRPQVRRLAAKALGQIGSINSVEFLVGLLNDPDRGVRATAAIALGNYRHPMAVQKIIELYPQANAAARSDMIYALANINDLLAVPFLIKQANDPNPSVRAAIMLALGKLGDARAIPALLKGLEDRDEITRINAAYSLGTYYSPQVVTALVKSLKDPAGRVRRAAVDSLKGLSGMDFGLSYQKWQQWWQQQRRQMQSSH